MKKIIMSMNALVAIPCALWAQNITANSTAEECLDFISKSMSYGEHTKLTKAEYSNNGIKNTYQIEEAIMTMEFWYLDWASFRDIQVLERNEKKSHHVVLNFDSDHLFHSEISKGQVLSRKALRSDVIEFYVLSENESVVSSIKKAAERLAELARLKASPLLKVNAPEGWAEAIPSYPKYLEDHEAFAQKLGIWGITFQDGATDERWLVIYGNDETDTEHVARIEKHRLKSVHSDGKSLILTGDVMYVSSDEPMIKGLDSFSIPLVLSKLGDDAETSFVVGMTKCFLWDNGFDLGPDGYDIKKYLPKNRSNL